MYSLPDHPVVANLLRTGYPDGKEPNTVRCTSCNEDAEFFYVNKVGEIVGCERCLTIRHYYEFEED